MNPSPSKIISEIIGFIKENQIASKTDYILKAIKEDENNAKTIYQLGISCAENNRLNDALKIFECLQINNKNDERIPYNLGLIQSMLGDHQGALKAYDMALELKPDDVETLINKGSSCNDLKDYVLALEVLDKAILIRPNIPEAWSNKGIALNNLNLYRESISAYDEAIKIAPDYHEAFSNKSAPLNKLKQFLEALDVCDKAISLKPDYAEAWSNKGIILNELKRFDEAIAHYDKAISLKPDYAEAWSNKGVSLHELKRFDEAIAHYDKAISLKPDYAEAWSNKGVSLHELKCYDEAITHYDKALCLKPSIDWVYGELLHTKMKICSWSGLEESLGDIFKKVAAKERAADPFVLLALNDDAFLHKKSSEICIKDQHPFNYDLGSIPRHPKNKKIRIGYFSADFKDHPVAFLIAELFEVHDTSRFEIYAFSLVRAADEMTGRLHQVFDYFIDVDDRSDLEIAQLARDLNIDIAVDLTGFTQGSRTGIFSYRAAPIQVNYLGYPGTMGAGYIDYIIADKTLIPPESQSCYSEKIVYLPNSYQVNDRKRAISARQFTRQELGLSENGFVFCCFNNNFKILPVTFDGWMRILKAVEGSVLWLLRDNSWAVENLKKEAQKQGVNAERLVFADRVPSSEHLSRHHQADLFLDTLPYNAHTTTSDALWTGLPVLTLMGRSFASRVAASLLNAIGLTELITSTQDAYEALAIELATNPQKLADIKLKLVNNRLTTPLFDTPLFTKNIEAAYLEMYERYQTGLELDHISIA